MTTYKIYKDWVDFAVVIEDTGTHIEKVKLGFLSAYQAQQWIYQQELKAFNSYAN